MKSRLFLNRTRGLVLFFLFILTLKVNDVRADYSFWESSNTQYYSPRSAARQMISLDLDPQNILNGSLRIAAREGRTAEIKLLLIQGAEVDSLSDTGETALMLASRNCYPKSVETLLQFNSDVNVKNNNGRTALIFAASDSCTKVVELLLKRPEVEVNVKDNIRKTALNYAEDNALSEVDGPSEKIIHLIHAARRRNMSKADRTKSVT